jgi:hypothetical protein
MLVCNFSHPAIFIDSSVEFWCSVSWGCLRVASVQFVFEND